MTGAFIDGRYVTTVSSRIIWLLSFLQEAANQKLLERKIDMTVSCGGASTLRTGSQNHEMFEPFLDFRLLVE